MVNLDLVIVTFNRLDKLKVTIQHYLDQTAKFRNLIVVNNCSTDGTTEYLAEWDRTANTPFNRIVINTTENLGGSGGFYLGEKKAMELGADWVFIADDDAYARPNMIEEFYKYIDSHDTSLVSAVCGTVYDMHGNIDYWHRDLYYRDHFGNFKRAHPDAKSYKKEEFDVNFFSYVGIFINGKAMQQCGLVNPNYFIYNDDSEHALRLSRYGRIVVVTSIGIDHMGGETADGQSADLIVSWREYYRWRNNMNMMKMHFPKDARQMMWAMLSLAVKRCFILDPYEKLRFIAYCNGWFGKLGKHKIYKPGWSVKK